MKVAIIPPKAHTGLAEGDYHLILPQLIEEKKRDAYKLFYKEAKGFKILDNGAAEGKMVKPTRLMEVANYLQVDEIVVPDVLGDAIQSYNLAREFGEIAKDFPWYSYMGVVQGRDRAEVVQSIHMLMDLDYVTTLAIPRHLCEKVTKYIRYDIVNALYDEIEQRFGAVHFLGCSSWAKEAIVLRDLPIARGIDSSLPIYMGWKGRSIHSDKYIKRPRGYFKAVLDEEQQRIANENIEHFRFWAS